ncbi:MAG: hypothetical protein QXP44_06580 [Candidatus Bathyarchaeia archaeon]
MAKHDDAAFHKNVPVLLGCGGLENFIRLMSEYSVGVWCASVDGEAERLGRLKPEEKVAICIEMSDFCVRVCEAGIRAQFPGISEEELLEKLRQRLEWAKRHRGR